MTPMVDGARRPSAEDLQALEGQILRLEFDDGHVVIAFLIDVDPDHIGSELIYELFKVESQGHLDSRVHEVDATVAASLSGLQAVHPAQRPDTGPIAYVTRLLQPILSLVGHKVIEFAGRREINFSAAKDGDHYFWVHVYADGEAQLGARLVGERPQPEYFWSMPFELPDYESTEALANELVSRTRDLMGHRSRIVQRRGVLFWSFGAEVEEADRWRRVGGISAFKWGGFRVPRIQGRERGYHSAAVFPLSALASSM